jgi:hypothetical protein
MRLIALDERARSGQLSQAPMMTGRDGGGLGPVASCLASLSLLLPARGPAVPRLPRGRLPLSCGLRRPCRMLHLGRAYRDVLSWLRKIIDFSVFSSGVYRSARHTFACAAEAMTFLS